VLKGLGACPGVIERTAAVLLEPDTAVRLDGEILVTRQTDPGWVVLFPSISGLVVERGSMLSHSAIVAREMGIPAVVGVPGAASRIRTGDLLHLDGSRGTVEILRTGDGGGE
jgi:pyruvate,water dikinase